MGPFRVYGALYSSPASRDVSRNACNQTCQYLAYNSPQLLPMLQVYLCLRSILGESPASEVYMPTFRNTLSVPSSEAGSYEE
jgi:hypothetical protein